MRIVADEVELRAGPDDEAAALMYTWVDAGRAGETPVTVRRDDLVLILETSTETSGGGWAQIAMNIPHHFFETIRIGWIPLELSGSPTIVPSLPRDCPSVGGDREHAPIPHAVASLTCFGSQQLSIEGGLAGPSIGAGCEDPAWLECGWAELPSLEGMPLFIDPALAIDPLEIATNATVVGHFDDPRALMCGSGIDDATKALIAVLRCRTAFVVDAVITPPGPQRADLKPEVELIGSETYANGEWTRHLLRVTNWDDFPVDLFAAAPGLPPCGALDPASRTWARLYDETGREIELYCVPDLPTLPVLSFAHRTDEPAPAVVHLELLDRQGQVTYLSGPIDLTP